MCAFHGKSSSCLGSFILRWRLNSSISFILYFESLYFFGFERKDSERELLYVFLLLREECIRWGCCLWVFQDCKLIKPGAGVCSKGWGELVKGRSLGQKRVTTEESGGIPILYKSVSPYLDISSGSFVSGHDPADVGVAELRNKFSRVIFIILLIYYFTPSVVYLVLVTPCILCWCFWH